VIAKGKEEEPGAAPAGKEKGPAPREKAAAGGKEKK
jgi:hypothetical protein